MITNQHNTASEHQTEYAMTSLFNEFGDEFISLSPAHTQLVVTDFLLAREQEWISAYEYKCRIYSGNLEAYAKTLS
jgi:hypothetical protein